MATPPPNHLTSISPRAASLINTLKLTYLPHESGYIGLLGASPNSVTPETNSFHHQINTSDPQPQSPPPQQQQQQQRPLAAQSHNYYMLTSTLPTNYLHRLASDDTHILIEGGPVEYFIFHPDGSAERVILGRDFARGETPVVSVPGGCWKGLRLLPGVEFALMVNVLSPEFTVEGVRIGEGEGWVAKYEGVAEWASREFLTGLIGVGNWRG